MATVLTPPLHAIFSILVEEACGIHYSLQDRELFESKLLAQASEAGYDSLLDYYYRLRYDDPSGVEMRALVQTLVVHETYFFRELAPLRALTNGHLATAIRTHGRARIWSAACSTGEEPLTLAMLLDDCGLLDQCDIVASDISETALARARAGRHGNRALREGAPRELVEKYLVVQPGHVESPAHMREKIAWRQLNLLDTAAIHALGRFDLILCRNVLIYFREDSITRILGDLTAALRPDGVLTVGVSESLLRFGTALICEERAGSFFYRSAR